MTKILIVDDDADIRTLLAVRLKAAGYASAFATDAVTAIGVARKETPDVILLDLGLPGGSGLTVIERLDAIASLATIPVIVVSASDPGIDESAAIAAKGHVFISKPIDMDRLLHAIRIAAGD